MTKPMCYSCKHREDLTYSAHSLCTGLCEKKDCFVAYMLFEAGALGTVVKAHDHGVKMGWFNWPIDFDPIWLEECKLYEKKEGEDETSSGS